MPWIVDWNEIKLTNFGRNSREERTRLKNRVISRSALYRGSTSAEVPIISIWISTSTYLIKLKSVIMPLLNAPFTILLYLQTFVCCNLLFIPYSVLFTSCKNTDQTPRYDNLKLRCKLQTKHYTISSLLRSSSRCARYYDNVIICALFCTCKMHIWNT